MPGLRRAILLPAPTARPPTASRRAAHRLPLSPGAYRPHRRCPSPTPRLPPTAYRLPHPRPHSSANPRYRAAGTSSSQAAATMAAGSVQKECHLRPGTEHHTTPPARCLTRRCPGPGATAPQSAAQPPPRPTAAARTTACVASAIRCSRRARSSRMRRSSRHHMAAGDGTRAATVSRTCCARSSSAAARTSVQRGQDDDVFRHAGICPVAPSTRRPRGGPPLHVRNRAGSYRSPPPPAERGVDPRAGVRQAGAGRANSIALTLGRATPRWLAISAWLAPSA